MELRRRAELVATSRADELSLRALADVAAVTVDEDARIVGGQMTALLLTAFPVPGVPARRTRDADTAITTELAGSGVLHERLTALGYAATAGNNYSRPVPELAEAGEEPPELSVDLLVPSRSRRSRSTSAPPFWTAPWSSSSWECPPSNWPSSSRSMRGRRACNPVTSRTSTDCWRSSMPTLPMTSGDGNSTKRDSAPHGVTQSLICTSWGGDRAGRMKRTSPLHASRRSSPPTSHVRTAAGRGLLDPRQGAGYSTRGRARATRPAPRTIPAAAPRPRPSAPRSPRRGCPARG